MTSWLETKRDRRRARRRIVMLCAALAAAVLVAAGILLVTVHWRATAFTTQVHGQLFDRLAPTVTVSGLEGGLWRRGGVTITVSAADDEEGSGVASITYTLDGRTVTIDAPTVQVVLPSRPDAAHTLVCHATDEVGNESEEARYIVTVDGAGPVTVAKPVTGVLGAMLPLEYRVSDALSPRATGVALVVRDSRGTVVDRIVVGAVPTGQWQTVVWRPTTRGVFTYTVVARDLAGNREAAARPARIVVRWPVEKVIGESVQGRPIKVAQFGTGARRLLVVGGVHGTEVGNDVAEQFIAYLTAHPAAVPDAWRIDVIPCLNPDGLAQYTRANARGVDLNRNFPSSSWKRTLNGGDPSRGFGLTGGRSAGSEPETRALMAYLAEASGAEVTAGRSGDDDVDEERGVDGRLEVVLTLHSDVGILVCYGPGGSALGARSSALCGLPVGRLDYQAAMTGTLEEYVAERYRIPAITFELTSAELTSGLRRALLAPAR